MSEIENSNVGDASEDVLVSGQPDAPHQQAGAEGMEVGAPAAPVGASRELILVPVHGPADGPRVVEAGPADGPRVVPSGGLFASRFALAAAAALGIVIAIAGALVWEHHQQVDIVAARANETNSLAQAVEALKARLDAIDTATSSSDLADLRRSIGEMKSTIVSAREFNGALAQLSQRVDKLDHEEGVKVDKLSERVDHETSALTAEISARVEKLEKKIVAPVSAPTQAGQPAQASLQPKFGASVSMETTGSIERPKPVLRSYIVLDARDDVALVGGRYGEREVRQGDFLPGAGRVERIERKGGSWIVLTSEGLIPSADLPPY
jgi:hypothetical protein